MKISARFREHEHGATKGFVDFIVDDKVVIKGARLVAGEYGEFVGLPTRKVGEEYKDVITGVSRHFSEKLLEAAQAARDSKEHHVELGVSGTPDFVPHVHVMENSDGNLKALASLTVKESEDSRKSLFTMSGIRVLEGDDGLFLGMPSVKSNSEKYPYSKLCFFTESCKADLNERIINQVRDALGKENQHGSMKASIAHQMEEARGIADAYEASNGPSMNFDSMDDLPFER